MMRVVKSPRVKESWPMRLGRLTGTAAWYVHQVVVSRIFITLFVIAVIYGLIKLAGISIEIAREGEVLLKIK